MPDLVITDPVQPNNEPGAVSEPIVPPVADSVEPVVPTAPVVPEKYELTMPKDSLLEPSVVEKISAYAKEKGLSNEAAQERLDNDNSAVQEYHENQNKQVEEIRAGWARDAEADPQIGGSKFKENVEMSRRLIEKANPDIKPFLDATGAGNHPEVIRLMVNLVEMFGFSEDKFIFSKSQTGTGTKSNADVFYNNTKTEE